MPEHPPHEAKIELIEQRAMVEHPMPSHPQCVARKLPLVHIAIHTHGQIARAAASHPPVGVWGRRRQGPVDGGRQRFEHRRMDRLDRRHARGMGRDHRPHQTARSEHHRGSAAGTTHHPHPSGLADLQIDLLVNAARRAEHHHRLRRHPRADAGRRRQALMGQFQQGLVEREVLLYRR